MESATPSLDDLLGIVSIASAGLLFAVALQQPLQEAGMTAAGRAGTVTAAVASPTVANDPLIESQPADRSPATIDQRT